MRADIAEATISFERKGIQRLSALISLFISLFLFSCATTPTKEELANADYGSYPTNYEQTIKAYMRGSLKDPMSAQYNFFYSPNSFWSGAFGSVKFGYRVCVGINAKNSYGGYTGQKLHFFLLYNDLVIQHFFQSGRKYDISGTIAEGKCS